MEDPITEDPVTFEELAEAILKHNGFISSVARSFRNKGINVTYSMLRRLVVKWDMEEWLEDIRKEMTCYTLRQQYSKAIEDKDAMAINWVLTHYKHHIDWLPEKEERGRESEKGWRKIIDVLEGNSESKTAG